MTTNKKKYYTFGLGLYLNLGVSIIFICAAIFLVNQVYKQEKNQALIEAEAKAKIILDRNMATHTYFSHILKPKVFELTEPVRSDNYFEPSWMSSTYAVREIDKTFKSLAKDDYYYKECAINARSPENEADNFEKEFIKELNRNPNLKYRSLVRTFNDEYYYVTLRRGEIMEETCLRCHSTPEKAPKGLVKTYGSKRSFNRSIDEVVSAISIKIPLSDAYKRAEQFSRHLSKIFIIVFLLMFAVQYTIHKYLVINPLSVLQDKALQISENEELLGEEISLPLSREYSELASVFNRMSHKLRFQLDHLEEIVKTRTSELQSTNNQLQKALDEIKILQGILPLCSYCKNIRDDKGYWNQIEKYICAHSEAEFSHSICPDCMQKHHPEEFQAMKQKGIIKS